MPPTAPPLVLKMQQGDLRPAIEATLAPGGQVINLTGATTYLQYTSRLTGALYQGLAVSSSPTTGVARYDWVPGDTDIPGYYDLKWQSIDSDGKPITVPNDHYDLLQILRSTPFGAESFGLIYRLRNRVADFERVLYLEDERLVLQMVFAAMELLSALGLANDPNNTLTFDASDVNNPLRTSRNLLDYESDLWVLLAARTLIRAEVLQAARRAAVIRSQASRLDMKEVFKAIGESLSEIEDSIEERLEEAGVGLGPPHFMDMWVSERRFIDRAYPGGWPGWLNGPKTWPWSLQGQYA